jgi:hypothetical protein
MEQLKTAIDEALRRTCPVSTTSTVPRTSPFDVSSSDVEKSKRFVETVEKLGWTIHPSVKRLVEEGRIPSFDVDDVAEDLEKRIALTQRIKKILREAPEGCRKLPTTLSFVLFLFVS